MNNSSINRISSLVRYDWMLHKHSIKLTFAVIGIVYICFALVFLAAKAAIDFSISESTPQILATFCMSFFSYAEIAVVLMMTTIVVEKFCSPRTATAYLTMPGSSLEKFVVVLIDFTLAILATKVLFLITFYLTMGIGFVFLHELDWAQNGFALLLPTGQTQMVYDMLKSFTGQNAGPSPVELIQNNAPEGGQPAFVNVIAQLMSASIWMNPFASIMVFAYYMVLVMLFKTYAQIKAIGCIVLTNIVYAVCVTIVTLSFVWKAANAGSLSYPDTLIEEFTPLFKLATYFLYCTPIFAAGLLYTFYIQIRYKQAK